VGRIWRAYGAVIVALRYPILLGWIVAAIAATVYLPPINSAPDAGGLIPAGAPAVRAEYTATTLFGLPLTSQVDVVQRNPHRFPMRAQLRAVQRASAVDHRQVPAIPGLLGALPVANTAGAFPGSRERSTTILTFLFCRPGATVAQESTAGETYARRYLSAPQDHLIGVTGPAVAQNAQGALILRYLPWVELATVAAIALIVGLYFRSVGAPLATLACASTAYLVAVRVVAWAELRTGVSVPPDLEPVLVVLLLGVATDYSVFFLAGMRNRLAEGLKRTAAARRTTAEFAPIIVTAGLVVAAGIASLAVARQDPLRAFGPALALTVLIAMVVASTLAPALIAIFGRALYLPGPARFRRALRGGPAAAGAPGADGDRAPARAWRERTARLTTTKPVALVVTVGCVIGLLAAALGLGQLRLGFPLIRALPANAEAARAEVAASKGFVPGILAPTEIIVTGQGVGGRRPALARLERALTRQPGVAGVIGPADVPTAESNVHLMVAQSGNAARYGLIERHDPLGPTAINQIRALRQRLPSLAAAAGLTGVRFQVGGETALAGEAIDATRADLGRIALAISVVILILLGLFLRALIAPFYLLAASVLALLSALGLTVWIFQGILGYSGLVYYVPFAVAVLLVSLGSDYNVFVVGRIWEEAARRPLREAVAFAVPRASRAITTAGLALAAGFALLALVPLDQFREIAVAMAAGIVLDTFVVRSMLVPALVVLFGRVGRWPGGRRAPRSGQATPAPAVEAGG
jgi:putative drug exporter of the RND superfamily